MCMVSDSLSYCQNKPFVLRQNILRSLHASDTKDIGHKLEWFQIMMKMKALENEKDFHAC